MMMMMMMMGNLDHGYVDVVVDGDGGDVVGDGGEVDVVGDDDNGRAD